MAPHQRVDHLQAAALANRSRGPEQVEGNGLIRGTHRTDGLVSGAHITVLQQQTMAEPREYRNRLGNDTVQALYGL